MLTTVRDGGVATLTLARPERGNALSADLVEALLGGVDAACADATLHTLVLRAEGRHFCTGLDLSDLDRTTDGELLHRLVRIETLLAALWHAPLRTVAVASGRAWGAGADLLVACERRLAHADTRICFPGAQFGIVLGTRRLAARVGADAARALATEGRLWDAEQAQAAGLVDVVLPADPAVARAAVEAQCSAPRVDAGTAAALRAASREDRRDADLAALVRSAAEPGLVDRVRRYRERSRHAG